MFNNWRYWLYLSYLVACIASLFILAWDLGPPPDRFPKWVQHICAVFYGSFLFKTMIEGIAPQLAFWKQENDLHRSTEKVESERE